MLYFTVRVLAPTSNPSLKCRTLSALHSSFFDVFAEAVSSIHNLRTRATIVIRTANYIYTGSEYADIIYFSVYRKSVSRGMNVFIFQYEGCRVVHVSRVLIVLIRESASRAGIVINEAADTQATIPHFTNSCWSLISICSVDAE
jgi:hypothetical protein